LNQGYTVAAVYTQPDRPAGRGQKLTASPVKNLAVQHGIRIEQPENFKSIETKKILATLCPDIMIVAAYGLLLPKSVLQLSKFGCINIHASLLPRWRGAAPIQRAILAGDTKTGITIMRMIPKLDAGEIIYQVSCPIFLNDTAAILHDRLTTLGAQALLQALPMIMSGNYQLQQQNSAQATYAAKLEKAEAKLNWQQSAQVLARQVRAFNPWPIAEARWQGQIVRIWEAQAIQGKAPIGIVAAATPAGIDVGTTDGLLRITKLQLPNRRAISALDFINAHNLIGATFE
jgi:methionyl-tRNA formyltransferase